MLTVRTRMQPHSQCSPCCRGSSSKKRMQRIREGRFRLGLGISQLKISSQTSESSFCLVLSFESLPPLNQPWKSIPPAVRVSCCLAAWPFFIPEITVPLSSSVNWGGRAAPCSMGEHFSISLKTPCALWDAGWASPSHAGGKWPPQLFPHPICTSMNWHCKNNPKPGECEEGARDELPQPCPPCW